jgi:hypothetical protein
MKSMIPVPVVAFKSKSGQTLLTLVIVIGGLIVMAAAVLVVVALSVASSGYAFRASGTAESVATAGVEDAALQLVRNAAFASPGYPVAVGSFSATVVVVQSSTPGYVTVSSAATVSNVTRSLYATFSESTTTGQVNLMSWRVVQ